MSDTWRIIVLLLVVGVITEAVLLVAVMRQVGDVLLYARPLRSPPPLGGPQVGDIKELPGNRRKRPALVLFTSPGCALCKELEPGFRKLHADWAQQVDIVAVVSSENVEEREAYARELGSFARADLASLTKDWEIPGTPYAVALDNGGRVQGAGIVTKSHHLDGLAIASLGLEAVARPEPDRHAVNGTAPLVIAHIETDPPHSEVSA